MKRLISLAVMVLLLVGVISVRAHDTRVIGGKYEVTVGWEFEPAFVGQANATTIEITRVGSKEKVEGVEKTLRIRVAAGGNKADEFALQTGGKKGVYKADYTPAKPGSYVFTFVGKIEDTEVNEAFESGPNRFDDVKEIKTAEGTATTPSAGAEISLQTLVVAGIVGLIILIGAGSLVVRSSRKAP